MLARDARALDVLEERGPAPAAGYADVLSPDECARVRELADEQESAPARVGLAAVEDSDVRRAAVCELELGDDTAWIYDRIASYVELANATVFRFDLVGFEGAFQYVEYGPDQFFEWHQDAGPGATAQRKLAAVCMLSRADEYDGGELEFPVGLLDPVPEVAELVSKRMQGALVLFPGYQLHRVTPVTRGLRRSLIAWINGPAFR